jgi:hypothetical protein
MLGLPATGKTSFGVALFGGLSNQAIDGMKLLKVHDPVHVLNEGLKHLARREPVLRSDHEGVETISLTVALANGSEHSLFIPDRSGESLRGTIKTRAWHVELLAELRDADAMMIFLDPDGLGVGGSAKEVAELLEGDEGDGEGIESNGGQADEETPRKWKAGMMPTDVRMVDALQEIRDATDGEPCPIAVVVSAWDSVTGYTPSEWLAARMPLLRQFLEADRNRYSYRAFGVSAQGEKFKQDEVVSDPDEPDPWDRAWAVDGTDERVSLAEPLIWLLGSSG